MKVRQKNYDTNRFKDTDETPKSVETTMDIETNELGNLLIQNGLVQHQDEAKILLANVLQSHSVKSIIMRVARHRINEGHVQFTYDENDPYYETINSKTKPKSKPFYRMTARRDIYDPEDPIKKGDEIFTHRPENFPDTDFECDRWSTKAKIGEDMPPGGWPEESL